MFDAGALFAIFLGWVITTAPFFFLTTRLGLSRPWWMFLIVPLYGPIVLMWIVALKKWPAKPALEVFE